MVTAAFLGLLVAAMGEGGPADTAATAIDFSILHTHGERACFRPPLKLSWNTLAQRIRGIPPRPSSEPFAVEFASSVPPELNEFHYYSISALGVTPIKPYSLVTRTRRAYLRAPSHLSDDDFYSELCVQLPATLEAAAFAASTTRPVAWNTQPVNLIRSGPELLVPLEGGPTQLPAPGAGSGGSKVKTVFAFSFTGSTARYLFVERVPDVPDPYCEVCCASAFDLYLWERNLPQVVWVGTGCDV